MMLNKLGLLTIFFVTLLVAGCGKNAPESIEKISPDVTAVEEILNTNGTTTLRITILEGSVLSDADALSKDFYQIKDILGSLVKYFPEKKPDIISFVITAKLADQYGNTRIDKILEIPFNADQIRKINFESVSYLPDNLAKFTYPITVYRRAGFSALEGWCAKSDNLKIAPAFCAINLKY